MPAPRLGGGISLSLSEGDLASTLRHVVDEVLVAHPARQILATFDLPVAIAVDHSRMAQMVSNLLSNAVIHGAEECPIRIVARTENEVLEVAVTNGGKPIESSQIGKLFLPFKRGDGKPGMQGLGLGLYIASQIAQAHGGRIEVRSDFLETRFTFKMRLTGAGLRSSNSS